MKNMTGIYRYTIFVAGCVAFSAAVAVSGTKLTRPPIEKHSVQTLKTFSIATGVRGVDNQALVSASERIEVADRGGRFFGVSLRKKDAPVAADADKTNPSPGTKGDLRKEETSPSRFSGSEAPERSDTTAAAPGATDEQTEGTDGECTTNSTGVQGGEAADAGKKVGKKPVGGNTPKKKVKLGKRKKECKKAKLVAKKKSKPLSSRDAEKKAQTGLKRVQRQTQSGLRDVIGNANRAAQAADKLAPEVKPSRVSEDHLDLGSSDDLGE